MTDTLPVEADHDLPNFGGITDVPEHEAGHAAMAHAMGIAFDVADVLQQEVRPCTSFVEAISGAVVTEQDAIRAIIFYLGGDVASNMMAGLYEHSLEADRLLRSSGRPHDDIWYAYHVADKVAGSEDAEALVYRTLQTTVEIMHANLQAAKAIARALRRKGRLSGAESERIWSEHGGQSRS